MFLATLFDRSVFPQTAFLNCGKNFKLLTFSLQSEKECAYYLRTGLCKFGSTCKFHHPPPSSPVVSLRGSSVYATGIPGQQSFSGGLNNWSLSRGSFMPGPSSFPQLVIPQGMVQVPGWSPYPVSRMLSVETFDFDSRGVDLRC